MNGLRCNLGAGAFKARKARGDALHASRKKPVGPPHDRVLFMQDCGRAKQACGHKRRRGWITAKTNHACRLETFDQFARLPCANRKFCDSARLAQYVAARWRRGRDGVNGASRKLLAIFQRAVVGNQLHRHAATREFVSKRLRGKQMAASASCRQKDATIARHATRSMIADRGRRRVTAMRKPMPSAKESIDDPP